MDKQGGDVKRGAIQSHAGALERLRGAYLDAEARYDAKGRDDDDAEWAAYKAASSALAAALLARCGAS